MATSRSHCTHTRHASGATQSWHTPSGPQHAAPNLHQFLQAQPHCTCKAGITSTPLTFTRAHFPSHRLGSSLSLSLIATMDHGQGQLEKSEVKADPPGAPDAERHAFRDDMGDSYGAGYTTRSADEGYGERYGEAVKKVMEKKAVKEEHPQGADLDQKVDSEVHPHYDSTQGHPVAQKEDFRHGTAQR